MTIENNRDPEDETDEELAVYKKMDRYAIRSIMVIAVAVIGYILFSLWVGS